MTLMLVLLAILVMNVVLWIWVPRILTDAAFVPAGTTKTVMSWYICQQCLASIQKLWASRPRRVRTVYPTVTMRDWPKAMEMARYMCRTARSIVAAMDEPRCLVCGRLMSACTHDEPEALDLSARADAAFGQALEDEFDEHIANILDTFWDDEPDMAVPLVCGRTRRTALPTKGSNQRWLNRKDTHDAHPRRKEHRRNAMVIR